MTTPFPAAGSRPRDVVDALHATIVGQDEVVEALVLALIAGGHVLLEGAPGVAKTLACRALAAAVAGSFRRVQFTPDLLPSDIVGTRIFDQKTGEFATVLGPLFANVVLATRSTVRPRRCSPRCSRECRSAMRRSARRRTSCRRRSSCSRR